MGELAAFLAVSIVVIVTPGPDTALTIRNTLFGGRRDGVLTALGVATGQAVWTLAASAGVAAIIVASEPAFTALKLAGAAYLVYLGLHSLWNALRGRGAPSATHGERPRSAPRARAYRQGLLSNLANPKMAAFFTSLLPQFAPGEPRLASLLLLGLVFCMLTVTWLSLYAVAIAKASDLFLRPLVRRLFDAVTGAVLVALGVRVAAERR